MGFGFSVGCSMFLVRGNVSGPISLGIHSYPMLSCILCIFYFPMTTLLGTKINKFSSLLFFEKVRVYEQGDLPATNKVFHDTIMHIMVLMSRKNIFVFVLLNGNCIFSVYTYSRGWECKIPKNSCTCIAHDEASNSSYVSNGLLVLELLDKLLYGNYRI